MKITVTPGEFVAGYKVLEVRKNGRRTDLVCRCDCGKKWKVDASALRTGAIKSCGCKNHTCLRHGFTRKNSVRPEWQAWNHMKQRCYNPNDKHFKDYGARGISVCERWLNSFDAFIADMGIRPAGCSLDRINNDIDYSPDNCRWATKFEQAQNKRSNVNLTFNGKTLCINEWSRITGIKRTTISERLRTRGWSVEKTLSTPVQGA